MARPTAFSSALINNNLLTITGGLPRANGTQMVMASGAQTIEGAKTFSNISRFPSGISFEASDETRVSFESGLLTHRNPSNIYLHTSGSISRYYPTLLAARAAAVSGNTIFVGPGVYNVTGNLLKNGVDWHFAPNARVYKTNTSDTALFDDTTGGANEAVRCVVGGFGSFYNVATSVGGFLAAGGVIQMHQPNSDVVFHGEKFIATDTGYAKSPAIFQRSGNMSVFADIISGDVSAIWWEGGGIYVRANEAFCIGDAYWTIYCFNVPSGSKKAWFDIQNLRCSHPSAGIIGLLTCDPTTQIWLNCKEMVGRDNCIRYEVGGLGVGGKLYVNAQKMSILSASTSSLTANSANIVNVASPGKMWITVQKIAGRAVSMAGDPTLTFLTLDVLEIEDDTLETNEMFYLDGISAEIRMGKMKTVTAKGFIVNNSIVNIKNLSADFTTNDTDSVFSITEGTVNLHDCNFNCSPSGNGLSLNGSPYVYLHGTTINTPFSGANPITMADTPNLILDSDVTLLSHTGRKSIQSLVPQRVISKSAWANTSGHSNITFVPSNGLNVHTGIKPL